jgi:transposase/biotin operon repressor
MANRAAPALGLRAGDRAELVRLTRSSSVRAGLAQRARIVLLAADGVSNTAIADRVGVSRPTVIGWRERYQASGMVGLADEPRSGRPRSIDHAAIITATLKPPPKRLAVTHWSTRLLARHLGISDATVAKAWREYRVQPWRAESFRFSTDPELVGKVTDVVGLYLNPPQAAMVLCVDEKTGVQALDRTAPILPLLPGMPQRQTHDYTRHGTTNLYAALDIASGKVISQMTPRHRAIEFKRFLAHVDRAVPAELELHVVCDNSSTHKTPGIQRWLLAHPRVHLHLTPTYSSWLNLVERWFSELTTKWLRRGTHHSVAELQRSIQAWIDTWNADPRPFVWTKTADEILDTIATYCQRINDSGH